MSAALAAAAIVAAPHAAKRVAEASKLRDLLSEGEPTDPEWLATVDESLARLAS